MDGSARRVLVSLFEVVEFAMSARTLAVWILALAIPIFLIIKPIQMFFEPEVQGGMTFRIGLGLLRRSDDPSLWSFLAALAATIAVYYGTRSDNAANSSARGGVRTSLMSWTSTLVVYFAAIVVYFLNVRAHGGTFFWGAGKTNLSAEQMVIEDLQDLEGFISVLAMFVPYFFFGLVVQMLINYLRDRRRVAPADAHYIALAGVLPFYAVAIYVLWFGALKGLGTVSPEAAQAIDAFKYQKLPEVLATQLLFWMPLIVLCAGLAILWRRNICWKWHAMGPLPILLLPSKCRAASAPRSELEASDQEQS